MKPRRRKLVAYLLLSWPPHATGYAGVPLLIAALRGDLVGSKLRHVPNVVVAVAAIGGGAAIIGWAIASHYRSSPDAIQRSLSPGYLVQDGAYARTRNPLYLGGALMWTGWIVLFADPVLLGIGVVWFSFIALWGVRFEERQLTSRFGATYTAYRDAVPRWVSRRAGLRGARRGSAAGLGSPSGSGSARRSR